MRADEFLIEASNNQWQLLMSAHDKTHWGDNLISLVQSAYKYTTLGSFVKSLNDVQRSDWLVLDWNEDNRQDCAIFYRHSRPDETWTGYKIQGVGHDRHPESKKYVLERLKVLLNKGGWWIESCDSMAASLQNLGLVAFSNEAALQKLFPKSNLKMLNRSGHYSRTLTSGETVVETVYGEPKIK